MTNRQLVSHVSYDFENWTRASAMGFRRDVIPPRVAAVQGREEGEQIHMGAGLWNRGNVIVGFYANGTAIRTTTGVGSRSILGWW